MKIGKMTKYNRDLKPFSFSIVSLLACTLVLCDCWIGDGFRAGGFCRMISEEWLLQFDWTSTESGRI